MGSNSKETAPFKKKAPLFIRVVIVLLILLITALSILIKHMKKLEDTASTSEASQEIAEIIARTGFEKTRYYLMDDDNWSNNEGILFDREYYLGGTFSITLSNASTHQITAAARSEYRGRKAVLTKKISRSNKDGYVPAGFSIDISTRNAQIMGQFKNNLGGITIKNKREKGNIILNSLIVRTIPGTENNVINIKIGGKSVWNSNKNNSSDSIVFNITDITLKPQEATDIRIFFNNNVSGKNCLIKLLFNDGSFAKTYFNPPAGPVQSYDLKTSTKKAKILGKKKNKISPLILENTSSRFNIYMDAVKIKWNPDKADRKLTGINFNGKKIWRGSAHSNRLINIKDHIILKNKAYKMTLIFSDSMEFRDIKATIIMGDLSKVNLAVDFSRDQANHLKIKASTVKTPIDFKVIDNLSLKNRPLNKELVVSGIKSALNLDKRQQLKATYYKNTVNLQEIISGSFIKISNYRAPAYQLKKSLLEFNSPVKDIETKLTCIIIHPEIKKDCTYYTRTKSVNNKSSSSWLIKSEA